MAATMINGNRRVTLPEAVRLDLGLEDGVEYVVERSGDEAARSSMPDRRETANTEQIEALEVMLASRRRFPSAQVLTDDDWDGAIAKAIVEDFRSEDDGDDTGARR